MTDRVNISPGHNNVPASTGRAFKNGGGEYIADGNTLIADLYSGLLAGPYNAFAHSSTSGLDVTFETGEAVVGGGILARDQTTTITLPSSASGVTISVGWAHNAQDTVKIDRNANFNADDPHIPLYVFDTDATTVTNKTNKRVLGVENAQSDSWIAKGDGDVPRLGANETVTGNWNFASNVGVSGYSRGESNEQADSKFAGEATLGVPWVYAHAIEAQGEGGPSSTLIAVGDTGNAGPSTNDEIVFLTNGNRNVWVGTDNLLHVANGLTMDASDLDIHSNQVKFDTEDGDVAMERASETKTGQKGVSVQSKTNPAAGEAILSVLSSGGSERLRVEHNGVTSTSNTDFQVAGDSVIASGDGVNGRREYVTSSEPGNWEDGDIWFKPK